MAVMMVSYEEPVFDRGELPARTIPFDLDEMPEPVASVFETVRENHVGIEFRRADIRGIADLARSPALIGRQLQCVAPPIDRCACGS